MGTDDAQPGAADRADAGDVAAGEEDASRVRPGRTGHEVEQRGLAGAVRADDRVPLPRRERQAHRVDGDEAAVAAGDLGEIQQRGHRPTTRRASPRRARPAMPSGSR
ncbi:MAG: hypothetical protein AUI10_04345 [Actinobacteria bacterium 13_2_20CM_2_72_6]|nr:MAG: hypothetical protein AUI10_04345 [Actinobacteria bacterium 13_2_20CM_2_72_6]